MGEHYFKGEYLTPEYVISGETATPECIAWETNCSEVNSSDQIVQSKYVIQVPIDFVTICIQCVRMSKEMQKACCIILSKIANTKEMFSNDYVKKNVN